MCLFLFILFCQWSNTKIGVNGNPSASRKGGSILLVIRFPAFLTWMCRERLAV